MAEFSGTELLCTAALPDAASSRFLVCEPDFRSRTPGFVREPGMAEEAVRRCIEVALSVLAIVLLAPTLLLIAAAIAVDSRGPIFYRQERVGLHGRVFEIVKFRTMRTDAEAAGARWASRNDPRITRLGRLLRLTRLDELPQLFNVIEGSMSLVGPRPERPVFVDMLVTEIPGFAERTRVRPGITGWAQVNVPYGASIEDARQKLAFDLAYMARRSIGFDLKIMLRTVGVMVTLSGSR